MRRACRRPRLSAQLVVQPGQLGVLQFQFLVHFLQFGHGLLSGGDLAVHPPPIRYSLRAVAAYVRGIRLFLSQGMKNLPVLLGM